MRVVQMGYLRQVKGIWRVRMVVPPAIRANMPAPYTGKAEITKSLSTGNHAEAVRLAPPVIATFQALIDRASNRQMRGWVIPNFTDPSSRMETVYSDDPRIEGWDRRRQEQLTEELTELTNRDREPVSLDAVIDAWKATYRDNGGKNPDTLRSYPSRMKDLMAFVGFDDVSLVTRDHIAAYRLDMINNGAAKKTWQNHLGAFSSVFNAACEHRVLRGESPMKGITIGKKAEGEKHVYSDDQRALVLVEGRKQAPEIRYPSLIAAFTGARIGEIIDCTTFDIENIDGIWRIHIREDNREDGQTIKTDGSTRVVPLHSQIIQEGFLDYIASIPAGPLFPQFKKDRNGKRSENGGKKIRPWIRSLGITDPLIKPMHAFRDYVQSYYENRATDIPLKTRCMITGHTLDGEVFKYIHVELVAMQRAIERLPNPLG